MNNIKLSTLNLRPDQRAEVIDGHTGTFVAEALFTFKASDTSQESWVNSPRLLGFMRGTQVRGR